MKKLVRGVNKFQREMTDTQRALFERLGEGQSPHTLFITCSDSRIDPSLITQTDPGELFILRNAGNIVPPYGRELGAEAAAIEFAVAGLSVENIVVCGHSGCGAMKAALSPAVTKDLPAMRAWIEHTEVTRRLIRDNYPELSGDEQLNIATQENVLAQVESLRTHPTVASRISRGEVQLHGWVYKISSGQVFAFDAKEEQFRPLSPDASPVPHRTRRLCDSSTMGP